MTKRFPGVLANDRISFDLRLGEIHALLGENGAGKSTLMNLLYGLYPPDSGEILLSGKPVRIHGPRDAIALGIGMVHQHFMLVPPLTVTENIMLGMEETRGLLLDEIRPAARIRDIADRYGLEIDPDAKIKDLSVGLQQRVEIVKALYRNARVLVLDEPTAGMDAASEAAVLDFLRDLNQTQGVTMLIVTHLLPIVLNLATSIMLLGTHTILHGTVDEVLQEGRLSELFGVPVHLGVVAGQRTLVVGRRNGIDV